MAGELSRYLDIVRGRAKARYLSADLEDRIERAEALASPCGLCERACGADRRGGRRGFCGVGPTLVASEFLHFGEEPELVPSHTVFFAGCTFRCVFCQNWDISQSPGAGREVPPAELARRVKEGGGINVNWVGGDPTPHLVHILRVLRELQGLEVNLAQVWNSNMYMSEGAMAILDGVIDVYLSDFKYGSDACAERLSGAKGYLEVVRRNHLLASRQCEILLRHLVMPGHLECCTRPVLEWVADSLPRDVLRVNVMDQYHPDYLVLRNPGSYPELSRRLSRREFLEAHRLARGLGLDVV
ncbi:MAG: radical SAM protein [Thermoplasmatota archaeon]